MTESYILLFNAGSSSLKCQLVSWPDRRSIASGHADWAGNAPHYRYIGPDGVPRISEWKSKSQRAAVQQFLSDLIETQPIAISSYEALVTAGHRIVHGGSFTASVRITHAIRSRIMELTELAPLHNPPSLEVLEASQTVLSDIPHIAVFDTSFHTTMAPEAQTYPIPYHWTCDFGIRRYGFHGLSHQYCSRRAAELVGRTTNDLRLVICHLGHGCSASAVRGGRCVDTTMGFTPLDGLMMATRSGSVDPGILLHLLEHRGLTAAELDTSLNRESGLLGVSGLSGDMRELLKATGAGHERASLALAIYAHRVRQAIGAFAVTMGGMDALVFTAGVGEHSHEMRSWICRGLECLGIAIDAQANLRCHPDADIASPSSTARILVIATREDLTMLDEIAKVLEAES